MRLWNFIKRLCGKVGRLFAPAPLLAGVESETPKEEPWNPCKWRGTKWVTLRPTSTGLYASIWYELDRNKEGRVTVIPPYGWDEEKQTTKNHGHWTTLDKKLSELLSEEHALRVIADTGYNNCSHQTMRDTAIKALSPNAKLCRPADGDAGAQGKESNGH